MNLRFTLVVPLALLCGQATLTADTTYSLGANTNVSFDSNTPTYESGAWNEAYTGGAGTGEQIVCAVANASTSNVCGAVGGGSGPGNANDISIPAAPANASITGASSYIMIDGDPDYGAPVYTALTGATALVVGQEYQLSFYQASSEEDGNDKAYDDRWQVYLIPGTGAGPYICPVCATVVNPDPTDLAYSSPVMVNTPVGGNPVSTGWELETYDFVATSTNYILEFVTDAVAVGVGGNGTPPSFSPPMLDLAGVSTSMIPEPGTLALAILGAGLVFVGTRLRRRSSSSYKRG